LFPSPKSQFQEVAPVDKSENFIVSGAIPEVISAVKSAVSGYISAEQ